MFLSLLLSQHMVFAKPIPQVLRLNAFGEVLSPVPPLKHNRPYRFSVQFKNPEESRDATFILRYDCIDKKGESFFTEEVVISGQKKKRFRTSLSTNLAPKCRKKAEEVFWNLKDSSDYNFKDHLKNYSVSDYILDSYEKFIKNCL